MQAEDLARDLAAIRRRFFQNPARVSAEVELSNVLDRVVRRRLSSVICDASQCAVLAAGGYGRRTLHPASDLDLLVVFGEERDLLLETRILSQLEGVGFEVGLQVKQPHDFVSFDSNQIGSYSAFFEARHLSGSPTMSSRFLDETLPVFVRRYRRDFLWALTEERDARRTRYEIGWDEGPDLKNAPGGLRDYHWIRWTSWVMGVAPPVRSEEAARFLHKIRNFLHYLSERDENVLRREHRSEIARRLKFDTGEALEMACGDVRGVIVDCCDEIDTRHKTFLSGGEGPADNLRVGFPAANFDSRPGEM